MAEIAEKNRLGSGLGSGADIAGLRDNPVFRQIGIMVGIAASVALGVAVILWSQAPSYSPLFGNLAQSDADQVMEALNKSGVDFKVDPASGLIMVPSDKVKALRMTMASQGLPNSDGMGFELLQQDTGFGTSRMVETARYQQAMQVELARTIATIGAVESARVHLAIPKQSVFVRKRRPPSASVAIKLYPGRRLSKEQIESIVHLVASSIPDLVPEKVTVVDQKGRLLSERWDDNGLKLSSSQFEYTRKVEDHFRERIETLLTPIVGPNKVQAQVTADMDFSMTEQTQESYNPDQPALRSEQVSEQENQGAGAQGVPGALSNQPPAAANAEENAAGGNNTGAASSSSSRNATRNYELDRMISHTRRAPAKLRRISVAVVVDDVLIPGAEGQLTSRQRTPEEMDRITQLVRDAIGFNATRSRQIALRCASGIRAVITVLGCWGVVLGRLVLRTLTR